MLLKKEPNARKKKKTSKKHDVTGGSGVVDLESDDDVPIATMFGEPVGAGEESDTDHDLMECSIEKDPLAFETSDAEEEFKAIEFSKEEESKDRATVQPVVVVLRALSILSI